MTLGELLQSGRPTVFAKTKTATTAAQLFAPRTLASILKADDPARTGDVKGAFLGSLEDTLSRLRAPLILGSACSKKPKYTESGVRDYDSEDSERDYPHYCSVEATFPDHGYVRCSDEDKTWKVPYTIDGDTVTTGKPEEFVAVYKPADEVTAKDDVSDGAGAALLV